MAAVATVDLEEEVGLVQAAALLVDLTEALFPHPALHLPVEVAAVGPTALVVEGMGAPWVEVQATVLAVLPEVAEEGDMDPTAEAAVVGVALPADVGVPDPGDTRVHQVVEATLLHSPLKAEGDIPTGPRRHKIVSHRPVAPAMVKDMIQRLALRTEPVGRKRMDWQL